jgi:hypothetical protein
MSLSLRAIASTVVLSGALCLTATGTAHAISGSFTCAFATYNSANATVSTTPCMGGPGDATSGTITSNLTQARFRCDRLNVTPFGSYLYLVDGFQCVPL